MISKVISSKRLSVAVLLLPFALNIPFLVFTRLMLGLGIIDIFSALMHFLGGVGVAVVFFNFWERNSAIYSFKSKKLINLALALGIVALAGVAWELFEFFSDFAFPKFFADYPAQPSLRDTMADLAWDLIGGLMVAWLYFKSNLYKSLSVRA